jgi:Restriction endonuclease S subunits
MDNEKDFKDLPEGWKWVRLGEVIEEVKEKNKLNKNLPILTSSRKGIYLQDEYFNRIVASKDISNYKMIRKGEFTYRSMSDDETFVFNRLENIPIGLVSPAYFVFQVKEGYSGDYLKYLLNNSVEIKRQIYREIKGTTRVALKFNQLTNFIVPLPPLPEQQKIVEILETIDNAIEKTDKIIEKYKRIKQGLMQDLLTKGIDENGNIRDEKTHKFKDSPLGRIPEEWEVVRLGEISKIKRGASPRPIDNPIYFTEEKKGRGWIRIEDIAKSNKYLNATRQYLSKLGESKSVKVEVGDLIMSICATIGKPIIINMPACIHDGFVVLKNLSGKIDKHFLYYLIVSKEQEIEKLGQTGTQGNLNSTIVSNFLIPLPPLPEQQRIAEMLSQIDQTIEKEQQYKEKLQRIKQGLMQNLLTGKVRVNHLVEEKENEQRYTSNFTRA